MARRCTLRSLVSLLSMLFAAAACLSSDVEAQTAVAIHSIMTNLPNSPYLGQNVSVSGIVVGVMSTGGFYITAPNAAWDTNAATAEGVQIYAVGGGNVPCQALLSGLVRDAVVGDAVTIAGTVVNGTAVNGANTPGTGIQPSSCVLTGTGSVSNTISLSSAGSYAQDLPATGMPASNSVFYAVSPTGGVTDPATGLVTSNGQFWVDLAVPTNGHLFKTAGLEADNFYPPPPAPASPSIPTWNGNPQRLFVDTTTFGGQPIDIGAGQTLTCKPGTGLSVGTVAGVGVIDYSLGYNRLLLFKTTTCTVSGTIAPSITSPADSAHFHVATLTLNTFHGPTVPAYSTRLAKAALAIVNVFGKPDILSVQEVQDLTTLQAIGDAASALAGSGTVYQAYWSQPNDATNLGLGFLVNTNTVAVSKVYQVNVSDTFTMLNGSSVPLWERPPFVLEAGLLRAGQNYQVEVVNIETTGRAGIDDPVNGPNVWERRGQQAEELSVFAQAEQTRGQNLVIAGEFNAYSFSDGFVDVTDIVDGNGSPAQGKVAQYEPTVTSPPLYNFVGSITVSNSTYNVIENGNARSIEHVLCSQTQNTSASGSIYSYISFVTQPHWTTDYPAIDANDPSIAAGLTQRDGFVGAFLIPPVPTTASLTPATDAFGSVYRGASAAQNLTFTNTSTFPSTVNVTGISVGGANAADFTPSSSCAGLSQGSSCTITVTFAPTAAGSRSATLTVTSDAGAEPTLTANLTGTGVDTSATLLPLTATYAATSVGALSAVQQFTWTNTSPLPLAITGVAASANFLIASNSCQGSIAPSGTCVVSVQFAPLNAGALTGTLTIQSGATANPTLTAMLSGTGVANIVAAPSPLNLGNVDIGAAGTATPVTVTNYSQHAIALSSISISADYTYTSNCPAVLASASQCVVLITFHPVALGVRTGTLSIATNDPASPVLSVLLTGNSVDFSIAIAPDSGTVIAGRGLGFTATITPLSGFVGSVHLHCTLPANVGGSTCLPYGANLQLTESATVVIPVTTTAQYTVIGYTSMGGTRGLWWPLAGAIVGMLLFFGRRRHAWAKVGVFVLTLAAFGASGLGCSGKLPSRNADPTYPGAYTYTVTATDGFLSHSASFSVAVKTN